MPKNKVSDPITDQEIAFARLILSGTMTDHRAAEAVGLNPTTAAYTKSKPRVRAYMLEHRALMQQQLVEQETEGLRRLNLGREQVLARLWEIANLGPEMTRGSITGQVKALSMIVTMQNFIPDRPTVSSETKSPPAPIRPQIYAAACPPRPAVGRDQEKNSPTVPACPGVPWKPEFAPASAGETPPNPGPSHSIFANPFSSSEEPPVAPYVPVRASVQGMRMGFSIKKNPLAHPR
jgi:hypothetical protein